MTDEWNPNDPDATRVLYDLSEWSFDQQAELAADLAEAAVPHTWEGAELVVPESHEVVADGIITRVEDRLGIVYGADESVLVAAADAAGLPDPIDIADGVATTEYDLDEWPEGDRQSITRALVGREIPYRWDDDALLVPTEHEAVVDSLLDMIENGEFRAADELPIDDGDDDRLPFETLTTFFLAGTRLQRNPLDADGLEQLVRAVEVADPLQPPYGVDIRLWTRTCELAEELADALAEEADPDLDATMVIAQDLHDLLRPFI
ncbi:MAG: hypothetical protein Q7V57_02665 [Actinomycetota bacterium]|nr:hypothetical protein [Actinomycetota bacterium]